MEGLQKMAVILVETFAFLRNLPEPSCRRTPVSRLFAMLLIMNMKLLFPGQARKEKKGRFSNVSRHGRAEPTETRKYV
jgi:hypothetical protein